MQEAKKKKKRQLEHFPAYRLCSLENIYDKHCKMSAQSNACSRLLRTNNLLCLHNNNHILRKMVFSTPFLRRSQCKLVHALAVPIIKGWKTTLNQLQRMHRIV